MRKVGVTGANGFIGQAVVSELRRRGDYVRVLVRDPNRVSFPAGVEARQVDLLKEPPVAAVAGLDAVIHLAGETVAGRWTPSKKHAIEASRVQGTRNLVEALRTAASRPLVLISASASGYYGDRDDEPLRESSSPGGDFLARVCVAWEAEAMTAQQVGARVVCLRQGLVLDAGGGALEQMLPVFRWGVGGALGTGRQWWPWIHREDAVRLFLHALDHEQLTGAVNAVAPDVATNARFARALGHAIRRPAFAAAPRTALRAMLGEFADTLLSSQLMLAFKAEDSGFVWRHPSLEEALLSINRSHRPPALQRFEQEQTVSATLPRVAAFFRDPGNLARLTPPAYQWRDVGKLEGPVQPGSVLEHQLRVHGVTVLWKSLITRWQGDAGFTDAQVRGPFGFWRHRHAFAARDGGTLVRDMVDYGAPYAPIGDVVLPLVRRDIEQSFDYRKRRIAELLSGDAP